MRRCYKFSETWKPPARFGARIPMISLIQMLAVAEYLNFYHAANALGVSQSTVSARIRTLEEDLGILLFKRQASGVRLTEAGRHLVEGIAAGIDHIEHAVKTAGAFAQCDLDRIHVGVDASSSRSFLDGLLAHYRKADPGVAIEIAEGTARRCHLPASRRPTRHRFRGRAA